jgi:hypothetical protein
VPFQLCKGAIILNNVVNSWQVMEINLQFCFSAPVDCVLGIHIIYSNEIRVKDNKF